MLRKLHERSIVIACFIPCNKLGPSDDCLLSLAEQGAFKIVVPANSIQLFFCPTCCSPDQAIVLDSIFALVKSRDLDHCESTSLRVKLTAEAIFLKNGLQGQ